MLNVSFLGRSDRQSHTLGILARYTAFAINLGIEDGAILSLKAVRAALPKYLAEFVSKMNFDDQCHETFHGISNQAHKV